MGQRDKRKLKSIVVNNEPTLPNNNGLEGNGEQLDEKSISKYIISAIKKSCLLS